MTIRSTAGWSLISSGITTLLLKALPGKSLWWGIGLLVVGSIMLTIRQTDVDV